MNFSLNRRLLLKLWLLYFHGCYIFFRGKLLLSAALTTVMLSDMFVSDAFHLVRTVTQWTFYHFIAIFWNENMCGMQYCMLLYME